MFSTNELDMSNLPEIKVFAGENSQYKMCIRDRYLRLFHNISTTTYSLEDILQHKVELPELKHPLPLFSDYLKKGYYPFALEEDFELRLRQVINQTLENDIPMYANMNVATGRKLKQLLAIISKSAPFKPNMTKIAEMLSASRNNISDYCLYIEEAGMIAQLRDDTGGIRGLCKVDKVYLDNTNLIYNLADDTSNIGNIRETFFLNQTRVCLLYTSFQMVRKGVIELPWNHTVPPGRYVISIRVSNEGRSVVKDSVYTVIVK